MDTVEMLFAIEQIRHLKARYFRHVDLMELEPLLEVLADGLAGQRHLGDAWPGGNARPSI